MISTGQYKCQQCGGTFSARTADRARGWARFCSKSCKASKQEARTGQHRAYQERQEGAGCFPSRAEGDVQ
jgi:transposase-like protein